MIIIIIFFFCKKLSQSSASLECLQVRWLQLHANDYPGPPLFTDYPHNATPRRNPTIRLLLQYLDEVAPAPTPHPPLHLVSSFWR